MAISVTVTSTKIDLTSTGGVEVTLDEICTAINDTTVMERTGAGPYVYTIKRASGQTYREFEISSGCIVRFEEDDTLNWQGISDSTTYEMLDLASGGELTVEAGFTMDFNSDAQTYARAYLYIYGKITMVGTEAKPITIKNYRSWYDYVTFYDISLDWVIFKNTTYSSGYMIWLENNTSININQGGRSYTNITVTNDNGNYWGAVYFYYSGRPFPSRYVFENWTINHIGSLNFAQITMKVKGWTISDLTSAVAVYGAGNMVGSIYVTSKHDEYNCQENFQPCITFEDCSFTTAVTSYLFYANGGSSVYVKNCSFNSESYGMYSYYGARVQEYGDSNTFNSITVNRNWSTEGTFLRCRELDITVKDLGGTAIQNAVVTVIQMPSYKERWSGFTNSSGKLLNINGDNPHFVQREETATNTFQNWSNDLAGGTAYHKIIISKDGYNTEVLNVEFTEDKTYTVTLTPQTTNGTKIYGSTIYGSVIY